MHLAGARLVLDDDRLAELAAAQNGAIVRNAVSMPPPAATGTIRCTGRDGKGSCAAVTAANAMHAAASGEAGQAVELATCDSAPIRAGRYHSEDERRPTRNARHAATVPFARGVTVMPEWFAHEGVDFVLDRVEALGATAIATSPYVLERCADGEGAREPPPDGEAGKVRPLDRDLFGARELFVRTAPAFAARHGALSRTALPAVAALAADAGQRGPARPRVRSRGAARHPRLHAGDGGQPARISRAVLGRARARTNACCRTAARTTRASTATRASPARTSSTYAAALAAEIATRYPAVAGIRLDWPEYPPYDFRSALFDFNPAMTARMRRCRLRSAVTWRAT